MKLKKHMKLDKSTMDWVRRINDETEQSIQLYGSFKNRPIKISHITEDNVYVYVKNETYKTCLNQETIKRILSQILLSNSIHYRYKCVVPNYGYGVPEYEPLLEVSEKLDSLGIKEILSVGAGCGFFDLILSNLNRKLSIESSDIVPPEIRHYPIINYTGIEHIENTQFKNYALLFVWPPGEKWVSETIERYRSKGIEHKYIILVGSVYEWGGCWSDMLSEELEQWEQIDNDVYTYRNFDETEYIKIYRFI